MDLNKKLKETGIVNLKPIPTDMIDEVWGHLYKCYVESGHVKNQANDSFNHYDLGCVLSCPYLLTYALSQFNTARDYLGSFPYLYSANIYTMIPDGSFNPYINDFHTDNDDERFITLFIYLTDVNEISQGPFVLVDKKGHTPYQYGPRGSCFLADTSLPHRGIRPTKETRTLAWFRYGVTHPNRAYIQDGTTPVERIRVKDYPYHNADLGMSIAPLAC